MKLSPCPAGIGSIRWSSRGGTRLEHENVLLEDPNMRPLGGPICGPHWRKALGENPWGKPLREPHYETTWGTRLEDTSLWDFPWGNALGGSRLENVHSGTQNVSPQWGTALCYVASGTPWVTQLEPNLRHKPSGTPLGSPPRAFIWWLHIFAHNMAAPSRIPLGDAPWHHPSATPLGKHKLENHLRNHLSGSPWGKPPGRNT